MSTLDKTDWENLTPAERLDRIAIDDSSWRKDAEWRMRNDWWVSKWSYIHLKFLRVRRWFINLKAKRKYQVYVITGNQKMIDSQLNEMQSDGWEIAGNIDTRMTNYSGTYMSIPMKRKLPK